MRSEPRTRIQAYRKLAEVSATEQLDQLRKSWRDRFGPLPEATEALVYSLRCRLLAAAGGVTAVESGGGGVRVQLALDHGLDLPALVSQWSSQATATATRIVVTTEPVRRGAAWRDVLLGVLRELGRLQRMRARVAV